MPIYDYRCTACKAHGTAFRTIAERGNCPSCTQCGNPTEKLLMPPMVAVFKPYRAVAVDKDSGERPLIRTQAEHQAFLRRNGYEEVGNDRSAAPLSSEEAAHRRQEKLKEQGDVIFDFDPATHHAQQEEITL